MLQVPDGAEVPQLYNLTIISRFCNLIGFNIYKGSILILLVTKDHMQSFKIVAFLLLGYFWLKLKFTSKCITVGGEGGVLEIFLRFHSYSFGY